MSILFIYIGIVIWGILMFYVCKLGEKISNNKFKNL